MNNYNNLRSTNDEKESIEGPCTFQVTHSHDIFYYFIVTLLLLLLLVYVWFNVYSNKKCTPMTRS